VSERTDETTAEAEDSTASREARQADGVAERFLELEAELTDTTGATPPPGTVRRGQIVDAYRVPTAQIPDEYPVDVGDGEALVVVVDLKERGEVQTYLRWPGDGTPDGASGLGRLLDSLGVAPEQLASLYGRQVLVEVVDGFYTLYVPSEPPRGESRPRGIVAGLGASLLALLGAVFASGTLSVGLLVLFLLLTLVFLPYETYRDSWYLRTHSDWDGGPLFWTALAVVPLVNVVSTALYLSSRRTATLLRDQ
jgi:hypothetical protein